MPITIMTGRPGAGKTLSAIYEYKDVTDRPVYYHGIKDLNTEVVKWEYLEDFKKWMECFEGFLIIVDEAQQHFPAMGGHDKPKCVADMATHRHMGFDIVLITQSPTLLHKFVREQTGRHVNHVRPGGVEGCNRLEWPYCADNPGNKTAIKEAQTSFKMYPKDTYKLYKSAEVHNIKQKIPFAFYKLGLMFLLVAVGGFFGITQMNSMAYDSIETVENPNSVAEVHYPKQQNTGYVSAQTGGEVKAERYKAVKTDYEVNKLQYVLSSMLYIEGVPWSAPMYHEISSPKTYPKPRCVASPTRCSCYSQQGTLLRVERAVCLDIVKNGLFDHGADEGRHEDERHEEDKPKFVYDELQNAHRESLKAWHSGARNNARANAQNSANF